MPNPYDIRLRAGLEALKYENVEASRGLADEVRQFLDGRIEMLNKLMAVDGLTGEQIRERVLRIWSPVHRGDTEQLITRRLRRTAKATHQAVRDMWLSTLPNPYWWYLVGRVLPEADYSQSVSELLEAEELTPDDFADEFREDPEFSTELQLPSNKFWRSLPSDQAKDLISRLVFPPPSEDRVTELINRPFNGMTWAERLKRLSQFAAPERLAKQFAFSYSQGKTPRQIAKDIAPFVRNYRAGALRIARTEAGRVAESLTRETYSQCDDLIEGIQVLAVLDDRNYPHHRTRHGQIYWKQEGKGEYHISELPDLPDEPNCRCWTAPVLITDDAVRTEKGNVAIRDAGGTVVDPGRVSDWFDKQTEKMRAATVGPTKYRAMQDKLKRAPRWNDFIDPETGEHLSLNQLRRETPREHAERLARVEELTNQIKTKAERFDANLPVEVARQIRTRLKDTGLPDPRRQRRKTAKVDPASQEKFAKKHSVQDPPGAIKHGNVSQQFVDQVSADLANIPPETREILEKAGVDVEIGEHITDVRPDLAGVRPRGWKEGTWENAEGLYDPGRQSVIVSEKKFDKSGKVIQGGGTGVLYHEYGHGVDYSLGMASSSREFREAYEADVADLTEADRLIFKYFLQSGSAGREEAFAEAFAQSIGKGLVRDPRLFRKRFKRTMGVVASKSKLR